MVRPEGLELSTFWFVAVAARRINKLSYIEGDELLRSDTSTTIPDVYRAAVNTE